MAEAAAEGTGNTTSAATAPAASSGPSVSHMAEVPMTERPTCVLILGMAGSGKTTFVQVKSTGSPVYILGSCSYFWRVQRLTSHLHALKRPPYVVNLDPAVTSVPYPVNIGGLNL